LPCYGWSTDSSTLAYCQTNGGRGDMSCQLRKASGAVEKIGDWDEGASAIDAKKHASIVGRIKSLGLHATSDKWAFARDLEITWDAKGGTLRVGARVKGEAPSWSIVLVDAGKSDGVAHPEVIAVSPDGKTLGALSHTFAGEFSDRFFAGTVSAQRAAAQAYNDAGFAHHKKSDFKASSELFAKATAADATFAIAAYNLSCAYAQLGDKKAKAALEAAIARAGAGAAKMKKNAKGDTDFAKVKDEAWFKEIVGG
jgi:hypothetical protein